MKGYIKKNILMCHAPIVIPEVGGERTRECEASTQAMKKAGEKIASWNPEVLIVLSPHTARHPSAFTVVANEEIRGDFKDFGAPEVSFKFPTDQKTISEINRAAGENGCELIGIDFDRIDHGAAVPLHFVFEAGWNGKVILFGFSYSSTNEKCALLGEAIAEVADIDEREFAILTSGDMSHRLQPDAPAGYHPRAREFDEYFTDKIKEGELQEAINVAEELREFAAEDVVDSVAISAAACGYDSTGHTMYSYEGPFGVGYLVSVLTEIEESK